MPHPIKLFGNAIALLEKRLNQGTKKKLKGGIMALFLICATYFVFLTLKKIINFNIYVDISISSIVIFYGLANRSLIQEVVKVNKALSEKGLEAGRKQLSYIVGRDTSKLDEQAIRKASLETLSENLSDGVIAPLFYLFLGGFPLMLTYKMVNTLDSMIGYKSARYKDFGFIAAKTDDLFNYIPARVTAILIAVVCLKYKSFNYIFKFGNKHSSPNAGFPEAALAGALNCQFGGASEYHGVIVQKPLIGDYDRNLSFKDVKCACWLNIKSSTLFLFIGMTAIYLIIQN